MTVFAGRGRPPPVRLRAHGRPASPVDGDVLVTASVGPITNLPSAGWGLPALADVAPALRRVSLSAAQTLWLDGAFAPSVREVTLAARQISGPVQLPADLDQLSIHLTHGTDDDVATLLSGVTDLSSLNLSGTPVTDAIIPVIERYHLRSLRLVDTAATPSALARLRTDHPEIEVYPRIPSCRAADPTPYDQR